MTQKRPVREHFSQLIRRKPLPYRVANVTVRPTHCKLLCRQEDLVTGRGADIEQLLTPSEVAALFRVDPKTVTRWAKAGKLTSIRTLGGHRRYRATEVQSLLETQGPLAAQTA